MACKANVDMVLTPDVSKDPVKWTMENCVTKVKGGYGGYPPLDIPKSQAPGDHHLVYLIENPVGSTWHFAKDSDALWVTANAQDPKAPEWDSHIPKPTIHTSNPNPSDPTTADTLLSFTDHNGHDAVTLHYTLNFVNAGKSSSTLDPIINNGGCCDKSYSFSGTIEMTGGELALYLVIAFVAGLVAMRMFRR